MYMHTQVCVSMQVCVQTNVCTFMWRLDNNLGLSFLKGCPPYLRQSLSLA